MDAPELKLIHTWTTCVEAQNTTEQLMKNSKYELKYAKKEQTYSVTLQPKFNTTITCRVVEFIEAYNCVVSKQEQYGDLLWAL